MSSMETKMEWSVYERRIEAIIFAAGEPIDIAKISGALDIAENVVKHCIDRIRQRYAQTKSPLDIVLLDGAVQMCTLPEYADCIRAALALRRAAPLSQAAMEVLAVIAYNQPVTRSFIDQVRGVDCANIVRSLADKGLVEEAGRLQLPGRPLAYRTTQVFLRSFGIAGLEQLPTLPKEPLEADKAEGEGRETQEELQGQIDFSELE